MARRENSDAFSTRQILVALDNSNYTVGAGGCMHTSAINEDADDEDDEMPMLRLNGKWSDTHIHCQPKRIASEPAWFCCAPARSRGKAMGGDQQMVSFTFDGSSNCRTAIYCTDAHAHCSPLIKSHSTSIRRISSQV